MGPLVLPAVILALAVGATFVASKRKQQGEMTPERRTIFETAFNSVEDPEKLRALAKVYDQQGLPDQADLLRKRADLRELPPDVKAQRADIFRQGMQSQNPEAVSRLADAFENEGATGAAAALRKYAKDLALSQERAPNPMAPTEKPDHA